MGFTPRLWKLGRIYDPLDGDCAPEKRIGGLCRGNEFRFLNRHHLSFKSVLQQGYQILGSPFHNLENLRARKEIAGDYNGNGARNGKRSSISTQKGTRLKRRNNWRQLRFALFDRNPGFFTALQLSLDELHVIIVRYAELKKYDVTRHALGEVRDLLSRYLTVRDRSLRVPSSTMGLFFPSENRFDALLTQQLEQLKAQVDRGVANSDQELAKEITGTLSDLSKASWPVRSYFPDHGSNPVASFITAYLWGAIKEASNRRLEDVALVGADQLRELCTGSIDRDLYLDATTLAGRLEELGTGAILALSDVVLNAAVRGLSDCLLHNCAHGRPGTFITKHLLEQLFRLSTLRLSSPLGLDMNKVAYSVGPFISVTERSSLAQSNIVLVNGIAKLSGTDDWKNLQRLRSSYQELNDRIWLHLAELGKVAVKKDSFLMHYLNSTSEEMVKSHVWLCHVIEKLPTIDVRDWESARERDNRIAFGKDIRNFISWQTTGVYSRVIPAMFEHKQLRYLDDALELQALFAFWCMDLSMVDSAISASQRIVDACKRLLQEEGDAYRSARQSILLAEVAIYALAKNEERVQTIATEEYRDFRTQFREAYRDLRFAGDFESAERDILEGGGHVMFDSHAQQFRSVVRREHVHSFFQTLGRTPDEQP